jgi:peroxidase
LGYLQLEGPSWTVPVGRRDARTASQSDATNQIPRPSSDLATLIKQFQDHGLTPTDLTALSGAHTKGLVHCTTFKNRIYNDTNIDTNFATLRKKTCPISGGDTNLALLDVLTTTRFDNHYYKNLVGSKHLFHYDQVLLLLILNIFLPFFAHTKLKCNTATA